MKISVSTYSFGGYIDPSRLGYIGVMDKALEMGFDGIEIVESEYTTNPDIIHQIKTHSEYIGLPIVSFDVGADFTKNDCKSLDEEIERVKSLVDIAAALGTKKMRHDVSYGNFTDPSIEFEDVLPTIAEGCRAVAEYASKLGVMTMFENHGYFVQDSDRVEKLIKTVDHPNFGYLLDIGNFMCADEDPRIATEKLAKYAVHAHAKDFYLVNNAPESPGNGWFPTRSGNWLCGAIIGKGTAGCRYSLNKLKEIGYKNYITIEFEGLEDNLVGIKEGLENLKNLIK